MHRATAPRAALVTPERYEAAPSFAEYLATVVKNRDWWHAAYRIASISEDHAARANDLPVGWKLLALSEDWCGDAVNILPYVARFVETASSKLQLRVLGRDANADIMMAHLTGRSRSIPIVLALDSNYLEHGWWGPRPKPLQEHAIGDWWTLPKDERRLRIRTFYARDRGRHILEEILELLEGASAGP